MCVCVCVRHRHLIYGQTNFHINKHIESRTPMRCTLFSVRFESTLAMVRPNFSVSFPFFFFSIFAFGSIFVVSHSPLPSSTISRLDNNNRPRKKNHLASPRNRMKSYSTKTQSRMLALSSTIFLIFFSRFFCLHSRSFIRSVRIEQK